MNIDDDIDGKDLEIQVEKLLDHSQFDLSRLPLLKSQLDDINRLEQPNLYIEKLNDLDKIVHDLEENILNIEKLYSQLNENERLKFDQQIHLLRTEINREMTELGRLSEQMTTEENISPIDEVHNEENFELNPISNELRQRHVTTNSLNDSYDSLEQDLVYLREKIDEVQALVARQQQQQEQILSRTEYLKTIAQDRIYNASSFFQKAIYNRYVTVASGALIGASICGPVGFTMGTKIGALVTLSGSALGALSMNIMRQKVTETDETENNNAIAYNQAML